MYPFVRVFLGLAQLVSFGMHGIVNIQPETSVPGSGVYRYQGLILKISEGVFPEANIERLC